MTIDSRGGGAASLRAQRSKAAKPASSRAASIGAALGVLFIIGMFVAMFTNGAATSNVDGTASAQSANAVPTKATIADQALADPAKMVTLQQMGRDQLATILKDPDSAKYRNVVAVSPPRSKGNVAFCGLVNAKSGFGAYAGYTRFISVPSVGAWLRNSPGIRFSEVWHDFCQDRFVISRAEFVN